MRFLCLAAATAAAIIAVQPAAAAPAAQPAAAQRDAGFATRKALAARYFDLANSKTMTTTLTDAMLREDAVVGGTTDKGRRERMIRVITEVQSEYWPKVVDIASDHYANIFTLEELEALVAFYGSPMGQAIVEKSTAGAAAYAAAVSDVMRDMQIEMMRRMMAEFADDKPLTERAGPA